MSVFFAQVRNHCRSQLASTVRSSVQIINCRFYSSVSSSSPQSSFINSSSTLASKNDANKLPHASTPSLSADTTIDSSKSSRTNKNNSGAVPDVVLFVGEGDLSGCISVHCYKAKLGDAFQLTSQKTNQIYYGVTVNVWADIAWVRVLDENVIPTKGDVAVLTRLLSSTSDSTTASPSSLMRQRQEPWAVPVGDEVLGKILDCNFYPVELFEEKHAHETFQPTQFDYISTWQPAIAERKRITESIHTGIKCIDCLVPLGRGQCLLVYGEKGTGKTTMCLDIICSQETAKCVYVAMGKSKQEMQGIVKELKQRGNAFERTVILWSDPENSRKIDIFALPHLAVTVAQSFRDKGEHAIIVYDDFNTHIPIYTELCSMIDKQMTKMIERHVLWRLFYSGIAQRSACLGDSLGGGTLTSLLILEVPEFVPDEMMSVSDGQICLSRDILFSRLPADQRAIVEAQQAINRGTSASDDRTEASVGYSSALNINGDGEMSRTLKKDELFWPCIDIRKSLSRIGSGTLLPSVLLSLCKTLRGDLLQWLDEPKAHSMSGSRKAARVLHALRQPKSSFVPREDLAIVLFSVCTERLIPILEKAGITPEEMPTFEAGILKHVRERYANLDLSRELGPTQQVLLRLAVAEFTYMYSHQKTLTQSNIQ